MSSFGVPRRRMRGKGLVGDSLHFLAKLANDEHAFKHHTAGYLYVPKKYVANKFAGGRIRRRRFR